MLATHIHDGDISIDQSQLSSFYKPAYSGRYFQLNLPNEVIRSAPLWDMQLDIEPPRRIKPVSGKLKGQK